MVNVWKDLIDKKKIQMQSKVGVAKTLEHFTLLHPMSFLKVWTITYICFVKVEFNSIWHVTNEVP